MIETIKFWSQIIGTVMTLSSIYFTGRKSLIGPFLGAAAILPWSAFALAADATVMLLLNAIITVLHLRILLQWAEGRDVR